jgi:hypothetical protein
LSPEGARERFVSYVCYMPVADVTQEELRKKRGAFEMRLGTTHWPNAVMVRPNEVRIRSEEDRIEKRDGTEDPWNRNRPVTEPVLSERAYKLTGIPYIKEEA